MNFEEKTLKENVIYEGRIITLHVDDIELPDGSKAIREVVEHSGGVCVVAVDDEINIYMVRQFRYAIGRAVLEIPAGKLEKGEDPLEAAKRELSEETGFTAEKWLSLGEMYPTPGYCSEKLYVYLARNLAAGEAHLDDGEILTAEKMKLSDVVKMIMDCKISDAKTVFGVLKADKLLND